MDMEVMSLPSELQTARVHPRMDCSFVSASEHVKQNFAWARNSMLRQRFIAIVVALVDRAASHIRKIERTIVLGEMKKSEP
jgi:hypothetical protein